MSRILPSMAGNDAIHWVSPLALHDLLPERRISDDGLLAILLEADAAPGAKVVRMVRLLPAMLWLQASRSDRTRYVPPRTAWARPPVPAAVP